MVTELNAFNIGLDLSGIVLSLTGIVGVIISRKIMKRNWILFVSMFGANIAVMLSNLQGDVSAVNSYHGEFMAQYSWSEFITGYLENR